MKPAVIRFRDMSDELIELWKSYCRAQAAYQSPFYWPQFTSAVAKIRDDVRIALFERKGEVVGFLPFHLTNSGAGKPIGGELNDYQGPILAPRVQMSPAELLQAACITSYDYNHLPVSFTKLSASAHSQSISPQMDLSEGYDAFVERKDSRWTKAKREMRRRYRKTEKDIGPIRFQYHTDSSKIFAQHTAMKNSLYARAGTRFRIKDDWIGRVLELLRNTQDEEFSGVLTTLHAGDRLLASHFGLRTKCTWHWWFPAYDLEAYKLGPGINLVDQCAMAATGKGISLIDFGRGDGAFKLLFADTQVDLCEGAIVQPGTLASAVRSGTQSLVSLAEKLPLGRYASYPRRAAQKYITGVTLPGGASLRAERSSS